MLLECSIKATLVLAAAALGAALLRRRSAAARHQMWTLGVVSAVLLPLLCWLMPSLLSVSLPAAPTARTLEGPAMFVRATSDAAPSWPAWLAIVWAAGALIVLVRALRGQLAARTLVRGATVIGNESRVPVLRSEHVTTPMTVGIVRPCVLVPAAADAWSPARLRAVLVHELGHVRRRDTAIQLVAQLACALYWWNPLAWLAAARLRVEREHACDDLVIEAGILPSSYAADLLDVARTIAHTHAGAICMVDRSSTEIRLRRILDARTPRGPLRFRFATTALALACALAIACTSSQLAAPPPRGVLVVGTPSAKGPITFRPPEVQAALDLADVTTEVKRRLGTLEQCYTRRLAAKPTLAGTVVIHWLISETGAVVEQCITSDTVGDQQIVECVNDLVAAAPFPASRGRTVDVSYPFVFSAR